SRCELCGRPTVSGMPPLPMPHVAQDWTTPPMLSEHDRPMLSRLPGGSPAGDMVAQRRAWEELAVVYNQDLPAIGALEENVVWRARLRAEVAGPKHTGPHPVAICLHGGGCAFGSPASFRKLGMQFA